MYIGMYIYIYIYMNSHATMGEIYTLYFEASNHINHFLEELVLEGDLNYFERIG